MRSLAIFTSFTILFIGCALDPSSQKSGSQEVVQSVIIGMDDSKSDLLSSDEATLSFSKDGLVNLSRNIYENDILSIRYHPARMKGCSPEVDQNLLYITGFYQVDENAPIAIEYPPIYARTDWLQETKIKVPKGQHIIFWFHSVDLQGCESWDSNLSQNYLIPITANEMALNAPEASISFYADGELKQEGALQSGQSVSIYYEVERLNECASYQNGIPQWGITGHYQTDMTEEQIFQVTQTQDGVLKALDARLNLPQGNVFYLWFTASNRYGCYQEEDMISFDLGK